MSKIKILIVEDHQIFRVGIKALLERQKNLQVVGEADNGPDAIALYETTEPDIILMDIHLPDMGGAEVCGAILAFDESAKILVLSAEQEQYYINEMMQAGALGYVLKSASADELLNAIPVVAMGNSYFSKEVTEALFAHIKNPQKLALAQPAINRLSLPANAVKLSKRETEILRLIAEEYTNKEIATTLFISQRTVDTHRRNLLQKLKVKNTAGLVKFYLLRSGGNVA